MKNKANGFRWGLPVLIGLLMHWSTSAKAFALLGPVEPWMQATNGVLWPGDIGGPMELTNEYRWNVPVVTYGFDQSFLDFFGTNGVAAVEGAIQIINDLPPASQMILTNYPFDSQRYNYLAQSESLLDLKSQVLTLLLQQLGLAQPSRCIYVLHQWDPVLADESNILLFDVFEGTNFSNFIFTRNYDPQNLSASPYVNQVLYSGQIYDYGYQHGIAPFSVDPLAGGDNAVANIGIGAGTFYDGLTLDDVGGLRYLLSTNNMNYETLLSDVQGAGTNSFVNGAWRPGVDKIIFVPQPVGSLADTFLPCTNQFMDVYFTNGMAVQQQLQRVTMRPDFLFSAGNDPFSTGTTNWINNAALNNNPGGAGPGIIQPPVRIVFQKIGSYFYSSSLNTYPVTWSEDSVQDLSSDAGWYGNFDSSTNPPIVYPVPQTGKVSMLVRVQLSHSNYGPDFQSFEWSPTSLAGTVYLLQSSTNLSTWNTLFAVTNSGSVCTYRNVNANSLSRFYRLILK